MTRKAGDQDDPPVESQWLDNVRTAANTFLRSSSFACFFSVAKNPLCADFASKIQRLFSRQTVSHEALFATVFLELNEYLVRYDEQFSGYFSGMYDYVARTVYANTLYDEMRRQLGQFFNFYKTDPAFKQAFHRSLARVNARRFLNVMRRVQGVQANDTAASEQAEFFGLLLEDRCLDQAGKLRTEFVAKGSFSNVRKFSVANKVLANVAVKRVLTGAEGFEQERRANMVLWHHSASDRWACVMYGYCCASQTFYLPYTNRGTLADYLANGKKRLPFDLKRRFIRQFTYGVDYLHSVGILHLDLKPANLLLTGTAPDIKIADFGFSRVFQSKDEWFKYTYGSPGYTAPEIILQKPYRGDVAAGKAVDVFAWAMVVYEIIRRAEVLPDSDYLLPMYRFQPFLAGGQRPDYPKFVMTKAYGIFCSCINEAWDQDPSKRPSMQVLHKAFD